MLYPNSLAHGRRERCFHQLVVCLFVCFFFFLFCFATFKSDQLDELMFIGIECRKCNFTEFFSSISSTSDKFAMRDASWPMHERLNNIKYILLKDRYCGKLNCPSKATHFLNARRCKLDPKFW